MSTRPCPGRLYAASRRRGRRPSATQLAWGAVRWPAVQTMYAALAAILLVANGRVVAQVLAADPAAGLVVLAVPVASLRPAQRLAAHRGPWWLPSGVSLHHRRVRNLGRRRFRPILAFVSVLRARHPVGRRLAGCACPHQPPCPTADATDREAARTVAFHPEQGWSRLCNGVILFDDTGDLLPDRTVIPPHRGPVPHRPDRPAAASGGPFPTRAAGRIPS